MDKYYCTIIRGFFGKLMETLGRKVGSLRGDFDPYDGSAAKGIFAAFFMYKYIKRKYGVLHLRCAEFDAFQD